MRHGEMHHTSLHFVNEVAVTTEICAFQNRLLSPLWKWWWCVFLACDWVWAMAIISLVPAQTRCYGSVPGPAPETISHEFVTAQSEGLGVKLREEQKPAGRPTHQSSWWGLIADALRGRHLDLCDVVPQWVLLWDCAPTHKSAETSEMFRARDKCHTIFVQRHSTGYDQPLDVSYFRAFKASMRRAVAERGHKISSTKLIQKDCCGSICQSSNSTSLLWSIQPATEAISIAWKDGSICSQTVRNLSTNSSILVILPWPSSTAFCGIPWFLRSTVNGISSSAPFFPVLFGLPWFCSAACSPVLYSVSRSLLLLLQFQHIFENYLRSGPRRGGSLISSFVSSVGYHFIDAVGPHWIVNNIVVRPCLPKLQSFFLCLGHEDPIDGVLTTLPFAFMVHFSRPQCVVVEFFCFVSPRGSHGVYCFLSVETQAFWESERVFLHVPETCVATLLPPISQIGRSSDPIDFLAVTCEFSSVFIRFATSWLFWRIIWIIAT